MISQFISLLLCVYPMCSTQTMFWPVYCTEYVRPKTCCPSHLSFRTGTNPFITVTETQIWSHICCFRPADSIGNLPSRHAPTDPIQSFCRMPPFIRLGYFICLADAIELNELICWILRKHFKFFQSRCLASPHNVYCHFVSKLPDLADCRVSILIFSAEYMLGLKCRSLSKSLKKWSIALVNYKKYISNVARVRTNLLFAMFS
jgi:hypothetical protein